MGAVGYILPHNRGKVLGTNDGREGEAEELAAAVPASEQGTAVKC